MKITDEIVAAAAKAFVQHVGGKYAPCEMDDVREEARIILEVAVPLMTAGQAGPCDDDSGYVFPAGIFPAGYGRQEA